MNILNRNKATITEFPFVEKKNPLSAPSKPSVLCAAKAIKNEGGSKPTQRVPPSSPRPLPNSLWESGGANHNA